MSALVLAVMVMSAVAPSTAAQTMDFAGWQLPLPAGQWVISRGPCGAATTYTHSCDFFENACAIDLVSPYGNMENVPVLAPQAGQVLWIGVHPVSGRTLKLLHADGRVSIFMHLTRIVVALDEVVSQGQVVGYVGNSGESSGPHLHFAVQHNAVERSCLDLRSWSELDFVHQTAWSHNRSWAEVVLVDPPAELPAWLARQAVTVTHRTLIMPRFLRLTPGTTVRFPAAVSGVGVSRLQVDDLMVMPRGYQGDYAFFDLTWVAPEHGECSRQVRSYVAWGASVMSRVDCQLIAPGEPELGLLWINPVFVSPPSWAAVRAAPQLCWTIEAQTGVAPLRFRAMVVGPLAADSGWIAAQCWQPPPLPPGVYYWKVYVRDARNYLNRSNQRPYAFIIE